MNYSVKSDVEFSEPKLWDCNKAEGFGLDKCVLKIKKQTKKKL